MSFFCSHQPLSIVERITLTEASIRPSAKVYLHPQLLAFRTPPSARLVDVHDEQVQVAVMIEIAGDDVGDRRGEGKVVNGFIAESSFLMSALGFQTFVNLTWIP